MTVTEQRDMLRAALVKLVGVDGREELEAMEAMMRLMHAPAEDKAATIDAIHALIATLAAPAPAARPHEEPMSGRMSAIHDAEQILEFINSQPKIQAAPAPAISGVDDQDTWTCGGCHRQIAPHSVCRTCTPEPVPARTPLEDRVNRLAESYWLRGRPDTCGRFQELAREAASLALAAAGPPTPPKCDCGAALKQCTDCAIGEWQMLHPDCLACCPLRGDAVKAAGPPTAIREQRDFLVNKLRDLAVWHRDVGEHSLGSWHEDAATNLRDAANLLALVEARTPAQEP